MPVQIGDKPHSFSNPTGLLTDCHRRIEMFMRTLVEAGQVISQPPTEDVRRALTSALNYFAEAAPKHTADEEASLFPRMRQIDNPEIRRAFAELHGLEEDHRTAELLHAKVEQLGRQYLSQGPLSSAQVKQYRDAAATLASIYQRHIALEDSVIFPLASKFLSPEQSSDIAAEMASRRKL